jgi:hypothetical protein
MNSSPTETAARPVYRYILPATLSVARLRYPASLRWKDKPFFFVAQSSSILRGIAAAGVPTALERQGNFSQTFAVNGSLIAITDPLTHSPFPGNIVPQSRVDLNGQKLLSVFPLPNITNLAITKGNYNYNFLESLPGRRRFDTFRGDYDPTDKLRLYYRESIFRRFDSGYATAASGPAWGW